MKNKNCLKNLTKWERLKFIRLLNAYAVFLLLCIIHDWDILSTFDKY